jgi:hypothetical protein
LALGDPESGYFAQLSGIRPRASSELDRGTLGENTKPVSDLVDGRWPDAVFRRCKRASTGDGLEFSAVKRLQGFRPHIAQGGELRQAAQDFLLVPAQDEHTVKSAGSPKLGFDGDAGLYGELLKRQGAVRRLLEVPCALVSETNQCYVSSHRVPFCFLLGLYHFSVTIGRNSESACSTRPSPSPGERAPGGRVALHTLASTEHLDPGFDPKGQVVLATLIGYGDDGAPRTLDASQMITKLAQIPGVRAIAHGRTLPLSGSVGPAFQLGLPNQEGRQVFGLLAGYCVGFADCPGCRLTRLWFAALEPMVFCPQHDSGAVGGVARRGAVDSPGTAAPAIGNVAR